MRTLIPTALFFAIMSTSFSINAHADGMSFARAGLRHCGNDVTRLCGNVFPGGGRVAQCLLDNSKRLSPACSDFVSKAKTARQVMFACQPDAERYCADVEPGRGRIVRCLDRHRERLADDCDRALSRAEAILQN